jgi:hypothetical protein
MATTTNFGWATPDDTDLVKDGAAAIRTLGSSIDTSLVDLKGGTTGQVLAKASNTDLDFTFVDGGDITEVAAGTGISGGGTTGSVTITNSMATAIDAKGDLVPGTGADTFARLEVGANGTVLTADSTETTGLKWVAPAAGASFTLLNSGGTALTGAQDITISGISGMNTISIFVVGASSANAGASIVLRLNGSTTDTDYSQVFIENTAATSYATTIFDANGYKPGAITSLTFAQLSQDAGSTVFGSAMIYGANTTNPKMIQMFGGARPSSSNQQRQQIKSAIFEPAATISSITIRSSSGNLDAGTVYVYGSAV